MELLTRIFAHQFKQSVAAAKQIHGLEIDSSATQLWLAPRGCPHKL